MGPGVWLTCFLSVPPTPSPPPLREPSDPTFAPKRSECNIINSVVYSSCLDYNSYKDKRLLPIIHLLHDNSQTPAAPGVRSGSLIIWGTGRRDGAAIGPAWLIPSHLTLAPGTRSRPVTHASSMASPPTYTAPHPQPASPELAPQDPALPPCPPAPHSRTPCLLLQTPPSPPHPQWYSFLILLDWVPRRTEAFLRILGA